MLLLDRAQLYCRLKDFVRCDEDLAKARPGSSPGRAISASTIVRRAVESFPGSQTDALRRRLGVIEKIWTRDRKASIPTRNVSGAR